MIQVSNRAMAGKGGLAAPSIAVGLGLLSILASPFAALTTAAGYSIASKALRRPEVLKAMTKDKEFAKQVDDLSNVAKDFAESQLFKQIQDGNPTATIFYLKTRGRKRGYGDSLDLTSNNEPITINVKINGVEY